MMKKGVRTVAVVLAAALAGGCSDWFKADAKKPRYRYAEIARGDVVSKVEATGTVTPRNTASGIPVGAQVNGKVIKLFVDYNSVVTNGQVVALIDPLVYDATYRSAVAQLHVNEANVGVRTATVASSKAEVELAEKTYARKKALAEKWLAPAAELDAATEALKRAKAGLESAAAALRSAEAAVEQSKAAVTKAKADLDYCTIRSPVNGVVISRAVEEGQTVVSSYNAVPVLTIAEDLTTVWVSATVPESDIGGVKVGQKVTFTADAYRRTFTGRVLQVRRAATTYNNVVTYPVIIEAENPDEMLFPGMTATLAIETARHENAVVVMAAALRFRPRDEDRATDEIPEGSKIWVEEASGKLRPVAVGEGVTDIRNVALQDADALVGTRAVIGYETSQAKGVSAETVNPFKHKMPPRNTNKGTAPEPVKK